MFPKSVQNELRAGRLFQLLPKYIQSIIFFPPITPLSTLKLLQGFLQSTIPPREMTESLFWLWRNIHWQLESHFPAPREKAPPQIPEWLSQRMSSFQEIWCHEEWGEGDAHPLDNPNLKKSKRWTSLLGLTNSLLFDRERPCLDRVIKREESSYCSELKLAFSIWRFNFEINAPLIILTLKWSRKDQLGRADTNT